VSIDETISKIDTYIQNIINDMINFRTKRVEASSKILDKLKTLMDQVSYIYRLGELFDKAVKVETESLRQYDLSRPRLKISYKGAKTDLFYNGNYISVPTVPVFVFETKKAEDLSLEMTAEALRRNIMLKFPIDANISEPPDMENAYGKYYLLDYMGFTYYYAEVTRFAGKKVTMMGMIMSIDKILYYLTYVFGRDLTIDGSTYSFRVSIHVGKIIATTTTVQGTEVPGVEYPCTYFELLDKYGGDFSYIVFGNEYTPGPEYVGWYTRNVLLVYFNGTPVMFILD